MPEAFTLQHDQQLLSLDDGLQEFALVYMAARNYSARTREEYTRDMHDLAAFLRERGILQWTVVSTRDLQHYLAELDRRQLKPSSRNRKTYAIKTFFRFLRQIGRLKEDPALPLIPPHVPDKEPRFLREHEYQALRAQIDEPRDLAIVEILLQTGMRISELAGLTVRDVQLPAQITQDSENVGYLQVRRGRHRYVALPLNWMACRALSQWLVRRRELVADKPMNHDALFLSRVYRSLTVRAIRNLVQKYFEAAGIEHATVQTLRHTMATHYLAKGGDLKSVQHLLGHESPKSTRIYIETAKRVQSRMVQDLSL